MSERRAYRITGRVQGVGFRWWARNTAHTLNLRGTVRNARDGSVEIDVGGPGDVLDRFEEALRQGPSPARVSGFQRQKPGSGPLPAGFEIVR